MTRKLDLSASLDAHIKAAREEITQLDERRAEIAARLEALEVAAGIKTPPVVRSVSRAQAPASQRVRSERAAPGAWATAVNAALAKGGGKFSYKDLHEAARGLGLDVPIAQVRVRVSKFKAQEMLEPTKEPGVYRPTAKGKSFFASSPA